MNTGSGTSCTTDDTRQVEKHLFGKDVRQMSDQSPFGRMSAPLVISSVCCCVLLDEFQNKVSSTPSVSP